MATRQGGSAVQHRTLVGSFALGGSCTAGLLQKPKRGRSDSEATERLKRIALVCSSDRRAHCILYIITPPRSSQHRAPTPLGEGLLLFLVPPRTRHTGNSCTVSLLLRSADKLPASAAAVW